MPAPALRTRKRRQICFAGKGDLRGLGWKCPQGRVLTLQPSLLLEPGRRRVQKPRPCAYPPPPARHQRPPDIGVGAPRPRRNAPPSQESGPLRASRCRRRRGGIFLQRSEPRRTWQTQAQGPGGSGHRQPPPPAGHRRRPAPRRCAGSRWRLQPSWNTPRGRGGLWQRPAHKAVRPLPCPSLPPR